MAAAQAAFRYDVESSEDELSNRIIKINCHGRLVSDTAVQLKDLVKQRIPQGGRILIDLKDVQHVDSSGLGTLVGLKVSAVSAGCCKLEIVNLSPGIADLLRVTKLTQLFAS